MLRYSLRRVLFCFLGVCLALSLAGRSARAQFAGGIFGAGGTGGGLLGVGGLGGVQGQGGQTGVSGNVAGGIMIDANGVVSPVFSKYRSSKLRQMQVAARAKKFLAADVNTPSKLRKVSLVKLEQACREYARTQKHVPAEIQYLAGLQRIDYVFVYPGEGDLVIAGPAEGFAPDEMGRVVGATTGRPPLRADDLVLALRAMQVRGRIGCSIDPQEKNLKKLREYVRRNSTPALAAVVKRRYATFARILGMQKVRVWGVPADSHFGQMLVEADYRMKRIANGLERPPVRGLRSYLSMLAPRGNSMQRWWFTPLYDAFYTTADGTAFQLAGPRAQLLSQEEYLSAAGKRRDAAVTRLSTRAFAKQFTEKFPELARKHPVFGELQNLIDLAIVAALIDKKGLAEKAGWKMSLFLDEKRATIVKGFAPREVPSMHNVKSAGGRSILGLVGGGVVIDAPRTLDAIEFKPVSRGSLVEYRDRIKRQKSGPEKHPWWWD